MKKRLGLIDQPIDHGHSQILGSNLFLIQVCSEKSEDEALEWIRTVSPSGTTNNWGKTYLAHQRPVACANDPKRTHYMFEC